MSFTITMPQPAPSVPKVTGNPADVTAFADELLRASTVADDLDTMTADEATIDGWEGDAATAYAAHVKTVGTDAQLISLVLRGAAIAADAYEIELTRLQLEETTLSGEASSFNSAVDQLATDTTGAPAEQEAALRARAAELETRRSQLVTDLDTMSRAVTANDDTLRAALAKYASKSSARQATTGGDPADDIMNRAGAPGTTDDPKKVAQWWDELTPEEQAAVTAANPEIIGSADGLPSAARHEANSILLENDLEALRKLKEDGQITPDEERFLKNAEAAEEALKKVDERYDPVTGEPLKGILHLYDPRAWDGEGAVAVAIGDPDTADNVSTVVPGTGVTGEKIGTYQKNAANLYESARLSDPDASTSTILWIGYDTPEFSDGTFGFDPMARAGAEHLASYVNGLDAARGGREVNMSVVAHSYGSTTAGHAATDYGLDVVDDLIVVGTPGLGRGVDHVDDLGGPDVWVGNASRDPVPQFADNGWWGGGPFDLGLGNDVAEDDFGAKRFQAEDPTRADAPVSKADHSKYFDRGTESIFNMGQIIVGDDQDVNLAEHTYDPWYRSVVDPEYNREPTPLQTGINNERQADQ